MSDAGGTGEEAVAGAAAALDRLGASGTARTSPRSLGEGDAFAPPSPWLRGGLVAATAAVRALGPLRYPLASAGGLAVYALDAGRRRRAVANHRRRRPGLSAREAHHLARRSFSEYGRATVDFLWANGMDPAAVRAHTRLDNEAAVAAARADGQGAILTLTHYGNWDMAALIALSHGLRLTTVMAPIGNPAITRLVVWARERNSLEVFTPQRAARGLVRALRRGRFVALLADIPGGGPEVVVDYCGGPVAFSSVPAWLALRTGAHLLPGICRRGGGHDPAYVALICPRVTPQPGEDERALMQRVAAAIDAEVDRDPGQWYPFGNVYSDAGG